MPERTVTIAELDRSIAGMRSILEGQSLQEALFLNENGHGLNASPHSDGFILFTPSYRVRIHVSRDELVEALRQAENFRSRF